MVRYPRLITACVLATGLLGGEAAAQSWYDTDWQYRKKITIDATKVSTVNTTNLTDFPVLISRTDNDLRDTANSGHVSQGDGGDILFTSSDGTTKLDHEIESYDAATGALVAWVEVPTVDASTDTDIYVYYGGTLAPDQWNITGTWDSDFVLVQHLNEAPANGTAGHLDSTSNDNDGTPNSFGGTGSDISATGQVDGADEFDGSDDYVSVPSSSSLQPTGALSISGWVNLDALGSGSEVDIVARKGESNPNNYQLAIADGQVSLYLDANDGDGYRGDTTISTDTWYHVAATWDGSEVRVYLDGALDHSPPYSHSTAISTDARALYIGGRSGNDLSDGIVDEVRISDVARSADWIITSYNNQNTPSTFYSVAAEESLGATVGPATSGACGGADCDYQSIQSALDAASDGDTIILYRRTDDANNNECYDEHITLSTANVTLRGFSTSPASAACIGPTTGGDIVTVTANGVVLKNLHISGRVNNGSGGTNAVGTGGRAAGHGIFINGLDVNGVVVENCSVDNTFSDNIRFQGDQDGDGDGYVIIKQCYLHHSDNLRNLRIMGGGGSVGDTHIVRNNLIHTGHGILVSSPVDYLTIERNIIKGWPFWGHLAGVHPDYPETADASHGGGWRYYSNCAVGIWVNDAPTNLTIQNNLVIAPRVGIRVQTSGTIRANTVVNPFNTSDYDYTGTILASDIRDETYGIMLASGFAGTIENNIVAVTADNRADGQAGQATAPYYTPGITGYGIAFENNTGTLGGGASITNNNVWGFVDTDGASALNYGSGITQGATNLSVDPQFAPDNTDETNGGSAPCDADGNDGGDVRCYELYEDNFFLSTSGSGGSCHADSVENAAGAYEFVDLSAGGANDADNDFISALDDCSFAADSDNSRNIDFAAGAVGSEGGVNGGLPNLGAFGTTDRASRSPTLRIMAIDVGDGGVKNGDTTATVPGLVQSRDDGITEINVYFNRGVSATSSSFEVRNLCDGEDLTAPTVDTSGAAAAPFNIKLTWPAGTLTDQPVRIHAFGDGADRIVDLLASNDLDGEISDLTTGTMPSGNGTAGGDAQFAVYALAGDVDGDRTVEGQSGQHDYDAITGYSGYPGASCSGCVEDLDDDGDVDASDLAVVTASDKDSSDTAATFTDISSGSGLNSNTLHSMVFADFNNDGYLDMAKGHTSTSGSRSISINDGDNTFTTSTSALPVGYRGLGAGDFDNDGDVDLVGRDPNNSTTPEALSNDGTVGATSWTAIAAGGNNNEATMYADIDGDGFLDIWNMGDDDVWQENDGDGTFTAHNNMPGLSNDDMPNGEGCTAADFDNDGYLDYLWNDADGSGSSQAWTNDGDFTYTNHENVNTDFGLPEAVGAHENMEWAWGDYDTDGDLDVFISGPSGVGLYDNDGTGTFTDVSAEKCVTITATTDGADWGDYDNDGDLDLIVAKGSSSVLYRNDGPGSGHSFTDMTTEAGIGTLGNVIGWIDIDNDGDLDLMSGEGDLLRNDLNDSNYLNVMVTGAGDGYAPRTPIGAQIKIYNAGTSTLVGHHDIMAGYNNFQPPPIRHFGLDPTALYDVKVLMPSSQQTVTVSNVQPNTTTYSVEGTTLNNTLNVGAVFEDTFTRSDSTTVGFSWSETDSDAGAEARILGARLAFDTNDTDNQPLVSRSFTSQSSGKLVWSFLFNMERTGSEGTYLVRMQLGDSAVMVDPATSDNTGVAVNLVWGGTNNGLTNHEGFGYDDSGTVTEIGVVSGDAGTNAGGDAFVRVVVDLDANTFDIDITGVGLISGSGSASGVSLDNNVDIDAVRIYFYQLSNSAFGDLEVDNMAMINAN